MLSAKGRVLVHAWDDYINFQLGPALLYVDSPLDLSDPPPSPQGSFMGKFPHRLAELDRRLPADGARLECREGTCPRRRARGKRSTSVTRFKRGGSPPKEVDDLVVMRRHDRVRLSDAQETERETKLNGGLAHSDRRADTPSVMDRGRPYKMRPPVDDPPIAPVVREPPATPTLQVTPVSPDPSKLAWDAPTSPIPPTPCTPNSPTHDTVLRIPLNPDPTSCNRLSRKSTLTLSLAGAVRHRVRLWRSSPIPPLAVRLNTPPTPVPPTEPPGMWEDDNDDPYAPVRERISTCQDRITEHAWVLSYGPAALAQNGHPTSPHADRISHKELLDASVPRPRCNSLLAPNPSRRSRRFSFGWERGTAGWERESARASQRIEHFEQLQEHYLGLMATESGRMRTAHVRTYSWGGEREGLRSA